jgi:hypothetical protein
MFTAELTPKISDFHYDEICTVVGTSMDDSTALSLDCVVPNGIQWSPQALEINVDPTWTPPPVGTQLRLRLFDSDFDGSGFLWKSWRFDLLDSGTLVAGMIRDNAGGSVEDYADWALATTIIWDGCTDTCGDWHSLWLRMSLDEDTVTMYPGDRCTLGDYQIWLREARGNDCSAPPAEFYGTEMLILNTRLNQGGP